MAAVERTLTINVRKAVMKAPRYKRTKKAVTAVREHLQQHMKAASENIRIGKHLNLKLWEHGIKNPIHKITVIAKKDDKGIVTAELPNIPVKKQNEKRLKAKEKQGKKAKTPEQKETKAPATPTTATTATKTEKKEAENKSEEKASTT